MNLVVLLHVERLVSEGNHVQITTRRKHLAYNNNFVMKQKLHNDKTGTVPRGIIAELVSDHMGTGTVQNVPIYKCRELAKVGIS